MAFACLLRQDVEYFDRPENSSGAISSRLSSDALAIQQMTGTRLGIIVEAFTMFTVGLILGSLFSWQLTLIVTVLNLIVFFLACMEIRSHAILTERTSVILERASSVGFYFTSTSNSTWPRFSSLWRSFTTCAL